MQEDFQNPHKFWQNKAQDTTLEALFGRQTLSIYGVPTERMPRKGALKGSAGGRIGKMSGFPAVDWQPWRVRIWYGLMKLARPGKR